MEEALMDHKMLRRLVLEQKLVDWMCEHAKLYGDRYFECEYEFGVAHLWWSNGWHIEWVTVEACPVDLNELPKGG